MNGIETLNNGYLKPQLNMNSDIPNDGLDLIINKKKKSSNEILSMSSGHSNILSSDDESTDNDNFNLNNNNLNNNNLNNNNLNNNHQLPSKNNTWNDDSDTEDNESVNNQSNVPNNTPNNTPNIHQPQMNFFPEKRQTEEEINNIKRKILYQFDRLEKKGIKLPTRYTINSSLQDMKADLDRITNDRKVDASIKFQRKALIACVTGIEFMNTKFDPINARLDGWSENVHENVDEYDDVFEELHDKYKGDSKMAPELRLLMSLAGSAFMLHLTNTMFKSSLPGLDQVMKQNPDLMRQFASATANTMNQSGNDQTGMSGMFANMFSNNNNTQMPPPQNTANNQQQQSSQNKMRGPGDIDNILNEINNEDLNDRLETFSTITGSDLSEIPDNASLDGLLLNDNNKGILDI